MKKFLFIVNDFAFFISHRLPIAIKLNEMGINVHVATTAFVELDEETRKLTSGLEFHNISLSRSGTNPIKELKTLISIFYLYRKIKPDLVHLVTIKPVLYGGILARFFRIHGVVAAVSGLGSLFTSSRFKYLLPFIQVLYKSAFSSKNIKVIFQNNDDKEKLSLIANLNEDQVSLIRGSGVSLEKYKYIPEKEGENVVVVMAARLLKDKGLLEYIEAVKLLKGKKVNAEFWLIGDPDFSNPTSISKDEFELIKKDGLIQCFGHRKDIYEIFSKSNIVVLPSYREGLPKVLAEAAACGRSIVTTDVPGCRDAIENGLTGILVKPKNSIELANAIEKLILDKGLRQNMGKEGRILAERAFDINKIVNEHIKIYEELGLFHE